MKSRNPSEYREPTYCPRCRRADHDGHVTLCSACGDSLVGQGYCPVCEAYLLLPVGASCPKHELELEPGPTRLEPAPMMVGVGWATIRVFTDSTAVAAARIRLEAEGIPTYLEGERMGNSSMYVVASGGVKLLVPADQIAEARVILDQNWSFTAAEYDEL